MNDRLREPRTRRHYARALAAGVLASLVALALAGCHTNVPSGTPTTTATVVGTADTVSDADLVERTPRAEIPAADPAQSIESVPVILDEWTVRVPEHVRAGIVTFEVRNAGLIPHELSILRTDLAAGALPVVDGEVDVTVPDAVASAGELPPDARATLTLHLEPGHYVLLSNLPAQYEAGMRASVTVE